MRFDMIHGNKRLTSGEGDPFGRIQANQQRRSQTGTERSRDGIDFVNGRMALGQRLLDHGIDQVEMVARRKLRDNATVWTMQGNLRTDDVGKNLRAVGDDRGGGLVTGGLDAEDFHGLLIGEARCLGLFR